MNFEDRKELLEHIFNLVRQNPDKSLNEIVSDGNFMIEAYGKINYFNELLVNIFARNHEITYEPDWKYETVDNYGKVEHWTHKPHESQGSWYCHEGKSKVVNMQNAEIKKL